MENRNPTCQAKTLDEQQASALLAYVEHTPWAPARNGVILRFSFEVGCARSRSTGIRWRMVMDAGGRLCDVLRLENPASKGQSDRVRRLTPTLSAALERLHDEVPPPDGDAFVIAFRKASCDRVVRSAAVQALFRSWFRAPRFRGATSHSGRRTGITKAARSLGPAHPHLSLRDVQLFAGHASIATTQRYIDPNPDGQRELALISMIRPVLAAPRRPLRCVVATS